MGALACELMTAADTREVSQSSFRFRRRHGLEGVKLEAAAAPRVLHTSTSTASGIATSAFVAEPRDARRRFRSSGSNDKRQTSGKFRQGCCQTTSTFLLHRTSRACGTLALSCRRHRIRCCRSIRIQSTQAASIKNGYTADGYDADGLNASGLTREGRGPFASMLTATMITVAMLTASMLTASMLTASLLKDTGLSMLTATIITATIVRGSRLPN